jgi:2-polyprenyl-6-methoxyphenol hydroxylase-like FAD-dependent oxidoreductase
VENGDILISGAGVAGPALAYWLCRYGFRPTLVERAPALGEGGYKVDIRGAAVDVAERMGIMADIRRLSTGMRGASFVDAANRPLATMPADFLNGRGERDDEIVRGDLVRILYERTRHEAEYRFGDAVAALAPTDAGVRVAFERAAPRTFALVVGADGLHSAVRGLAFGDEAQYLRHLGAYISIFTVPNHLGLDRWELYHDAPGKLMGIYSAGRDTRPPRHAEAASAVKWPTGAFAATLKAAATPRVKFAKASTASWDDAASPRTSATKPRRTGFVNPGSRTGRVSMVISTGPIWDGNRMGGKESLRPK